MSEKNKHSSFTKYIIAAVAAVLVIGVTVTAVMIRSHKKGNIVIEKTGSDLSETDSTDESSEKVTKEKSKTKDPVNEPSESFDSAKSKETDTHTAKSVTATTKVDFPIDVNLASEQQLCAISGIGTSTAKSIIDYRSSIGRFGYIEQLMEVEGIGEKTFQKLKQYLYVSEKDKVTTAQSTKASTQSSTQTSQTEASQTRASVSSSKESSQEAVTQTGTGVTKPEKLNINEADAKGFALFFGLSDEDAQKIVDIREKIHGFSNKLEILLSGVVSEDTLKEQLDRLEL